MLESTVESAIRHYALQKGCLFYKFVSPSSAGVPDRIIVSPKGQVGFLEIKRPGQKPRPLQTYELKKLQRRKVQAHWCNTVQGGKDFIDFLLVS